MKALPVLVTIALAGCRAPLPEVARLPADLRASVDDLYRAFCFDAGGGADWSSIDAHFLDGAAIVNPYPLEGTAKAVSKAQFLDEFRAYVASPAVRETGLHERILDVRGERTGNIAHTWVQFEGFIPATGAVRSRGLDSIEWVRDDKRWRVAAFTTQYETEGLKLP